MPVATTKRAARQPQGPALLPPRNAHVIDKARARGMKRGSLVVVSYVGDTGIDAPHVYADSGRRYDWRCLDQLVALIVAKPGVNCMDAIQNAFWMSSLLADTYPEALLVGGYPMLADMERQTVAAILDTKPKVRLWPMNSRHPTWQACFG